MGPFSKTKNGNKFIVVAIDYLTKYIEIGALLEKSAVNIAEFIWKRIICVHSCPEKILSDNGREFKNQIVQHFVIK
jgi:hypothetical protein